MWGYLGEFWNEIADEIIGGVTYTVAWFENIGNAVGGAIGNLFDFFLHHFNDLIVFGSWIAGILSIILTQILAPVNFLFVFLKKFIQNSLATPIQNQALVDFQEIAISGTQAIPFFSYIATAFIVIFSLMAFLKLLKVAKI